MTRHNAGIIWLVVAALWPAIASAAPGNKIAQEKGDAVWRKILKLGGYWWIADHDAIYEVYQADMTDPSNKRSHWTYEMDGNAKTRRITLQTFVDDARGLENYHGALCRPLQAEIFSAPYLLTLSALLPASHSL